MPVSHWVVLASAGLLSCTESAENTAELTGCLVGASDEPGLLYLGPKQANAVVALRLRIGDVVEVCSGVVLSSSLVLTAAHCVAGPQIDEIDVVVGPSIACPTATFDGHLRSSMELLDLALVELRGNGFAGLVEPIAWSDEFPSRYLVTPALLGGFGTDKLNPPDQRRFLVESVVAITDTRIVVDGGGRSGACLGDSGGPLLVRNSEGQVVVTGVLAEGSENCLGLDNYVRLEKAGSWLKDQVGVPVAPRDCGGVPPSGACFANLAVGCKGALFSVETCSVDQFCGWSVAGRYACLSIPETSCEEIDQLGTCDGGVARSCVNGTLLEQDCSAVSKQCGRSSSTGVSSCLEPHS